MKSRKCFLKYSPLPAPVTVSDFILGAKVLIHSRMMHLVEYGDAFTRNKLGSQSDTEGK